MPATAIGVQFIKKYNRYAHCPHSHQMELFIEFIFHKRKRTNFRIENINIEMMMIGPHLLRNKIITTTLDFFISDPI